MKLRFIWGTGGTAFSFALAGFVLAQRASYYCIICSNASARLNFKFAAFVLAQGRAALHAFGVIDPRKST